MSTKNMLEKEVEIPDKASVTFKNEQIIVSGPNGTVEKKFPSRLIDLQIIDKKIKLIAKRKDAQARALIGSWCAHIKNMVNGVLNPYTYKLKIVYTHFPISASLSGKTLSVQNFLGEKKAHTYIIPEKVDVKLQNNIITVTSPDIELAGQVATRIETLCKVRNKDKRIFLDGIYIIEKPK
ncbi:MAG: 50S ribosomal protein L6 [Candidatus Nanoarchaeia archaeon]